MDEDVAAHKLKPVPRVAYWWFGGKRRAIPRHLRL